MKLFSKPSALVLKRFNISPNSEVLVEIAGRKGGLISLF